MIQMSLDERGVDIAIWVPSRVFNRDILFDCSDASSEFSDCDLLIFFDDYFDCIAPPWRAQQVA
ncbi:hypothetical protein SAMN06264855_1277 [Halorubrum vacuolatum]|uniref:Uncharacterized protein n=1 Tax=Halorubrum vacuolatum TaxID=63740 RepID=A0A238Y1C6_HALVU|nr:hypothetical protein SAMN06264855_1277 [Halorubrum vacuolatum]